MDAKDYETPGQARFWMGLTIILVVQVVVDLAVLGWVIKQLFRD